MRSLLQGVAIAGFTLLSSPICAAQEAPDTDSTDTLLRAAYCLGVLKAATGRLQESSPNPEHCVSDRSQTKASDIEECRRVRSTALDVAKALINDLEQKRRRYAQYLAIRILQAPSDKLVAIEVVEAKGQRDTIEKQRLIGSDHFIMSQCRNTDDGFADCVARYDQVYANIVRCQHYPDRLPF